VGTKFRGGAWLGIYVLFLVHPRSKETQSLPLGPIELNTDWYARARLGFSTLVLFLWGTKEDGTAFKEVHTVLTRVLEKTPKLPLAFLYDLFRSRPDLLGFLTIVLWSDGGTHFKASELIGTMVHDQMIEFGWHKVVHNYGAPKHFKTPVDGHVGRCTKARNNGALNKFLVDVASLKSVYKQYFDESEKVQGTGWTNVVWDWMPELKSSYKTTLLDVKCLGGIRNSFSYVTKRNNKNRVQLRGRGANWNTLTGLDMVNAKITNNKEMGATFYPQIVLPKAGAPAVPAAAAPAEEAAPAAGAEDEAAAAAADAEEVALAPIESELLRDTRMHNEWRTSYSKLLDDQEQTRKFYSYLSNQMRHLSTALKKSTETEKRKLDADTLKLSEDSRTLKKAKREKATHAYYKALRG
jgi:hypothetical protein